MSIYGQAAHPESDELRPSFVDAALEYAHRGFLVFPVHSINQAGHCTCSAGAACDKSQGKHPATKAGLKDATREDEKIRRWWDGTRNYNVGIVTGAASDL